MRTPVAVGCLFVVAVAGSACSSSVTGSGTNSASSSSSSSAGFPSTTSAAPSSATSSAPPVSPSSSSRLTTSSLLAASQVGEGFVLVHAAVKTEKNTGSDSDSLKFLGCLDVSAIKAPGKQPATSQNALGTYANKTSGGVFAESIGEAGTAAQAKGVIALATAKLKKCRAPVLTLDKIRFTTTKNRTTVAAGGCDAGVATNTTASKRAANGKLILVSVMTNIVSKGKWAAYFVGYQPLIGADPIRESQRPAAICARLPG